MGTTRHVAQLSHHQTNYTQATVKYVDIPNGGKAWKGKHMQSGKTEQIECFPLACV